MLRSRLLPLGLASAVALTLAACQDNSNPTAPDAGPPSDRVQASQGADLPPASEFARQVPGFGGFFLDRSGKPTAVSHPRVQPRSRRAGAGGVSQRPRTHDRRGAGTRRPLRLAAARALASSGKYRGTGCARCRLRGQRRDQQPGPDRSGEPERDGPGSRRGGPARRS